MHRCREQVHESIHDSYGSHVLLCYCCQWKDAKPQQMNQKEKRENVCGENNHIESWRKLYCDVKLRHKFVLVVAYKTECENAKMWKCENVTDLRDHLVESPNQQKLYQQVRVHWIQSTEHRNNCLSEIPAIIYSTCTSFMCLVWPHLNNILWSAQLWLFSFSGCYFFFFHC